MKMIISFLDKVLDIVSGRITILSVENSKLYGNLIQSFYGSINSDYDPTVLIEAYDEKGKEMSLSKIDFIYDIYSVDLKSKRIQSGIQSKIQAALTADIEKSSLIQKYVMEINDMIQDSMVSMNVKLNSDPDWDSARLMKAFSISAESDLEQDNHLSRLKRYIDIVSEFNISKYICFAGLTEVLSEDDFFDFCKHVLYSDIPVLLIDRHFPDEYLNEYCYGVILDIDFDEFSISFGKKNIV